MVYIMEKQFIEIVKAYEAELLEWQDDVYNFRIGYTKGEQEEVGAQLDAINEIYRRLAEAGFKV